MLDISETPERLETSRVKGLLAVVDAETCLIVKKELESQEDFLDKVLERMERDNIQMHCFLMGYAEFRYPILSSGAFTYRCVEANQEIPKVTPETYHEIFEEFKNSRFNRYTDSLYGNLQENNPWILACIEHLPSKSTEETFGIINAALTIYNFLERQAENDLLVSPLVPFNLKEHPLTYKLRRSLNLALATEDYELAAELRDKINHTKEHL